jgi:hypothetical protein
MKVVQTALIIYLFLLTEAFNFEANTPSFTVHSQVLLASYGPMFE